MTEQALAARYKSECPAWGVAPDMTTAECTKCSQQVPAMAAACCEKYRHSEQGVPVVATAAPAAEVAVEPMKVAIGEAAVVPSVDQSSTEKKPRKKRSGLSVFAAALIAMQQLGGQAKVVALVPVMVAAGWKSDYPKPTALVNCTLWHDAKKANGKFAQVASGEYRLKD